MDLTGQCTLFTLRTAVQIKTFSRQESTSKLTSSDLFKVRKFTEKIQQLLSSQSEFGITQSNLYIDVSWSKETTS